MQPTLASHFIDGNAFKPQTDVPLHLPHSSLTTFHLHCLTSYLRSLAQPSHFVCHLTQFEELAHRPRSLQHGSSLLYGLLQNISCPTPPYQAKWEADLQRSFTEEEWGKIRKLATSCSLASKTQETAYKLLSRWYKPPALVALYDPSADGACWKCKSLQAGLLHMWWSCRLLQPFWRLVHDTICNVSDSPPAFSPAPMLLHRTLLNITDYKNSLDISLLNAAKAIIPRHWKSASVPTVREWLQEIHSLRDIEDLLHGAAGTIDKHFQRWYHWSAACPRAPVPPPV